MCCLLGLVPHKCLHSSLKKMICCPVTVATQHSQCWQCTSLLWHILPLSNKAAVPSIRTWPWRFWLHCDKLCSLRSSVVQTRRSWMRGGREEAALFQNNLWTQRPFKATHTHRGGRWVHGVTWLQTLTHIAPELEGGRGTVRNSKVGEEMAAMWSGGLPSNI